MIYIKSFKNYDEFKELFGIVEHGNGVKSRRNKILLACLKDRRLLHWWRGYTDKLGALLEREPHEALDSDYLHAKSMWGLKEWLRYVLDFCVRHECTWSETVAGNLPFPELRYCLHSMRYRLYMSGVCIDGDDKSVWYVNIERGWRVSKMKAGKFISSVMEEFDCTRNLPEQVKCWLGEEFAREWQSHASQYAGCSKFELHVDDDFAAIYDSNRCRGDFHSCMTDKNQHGFYAEAVNASAAYLTDADGMIVARCIVFNEVYDENGDVYRLAERQYATNQDNVLKQMLVDKLVRAGRIDGYKRVGVDCHDNKNFVSVDGTSMSDLTLHVPCCLDPGDTLSYQDSFVYYDETLGVAYNDGSRHYYNSELDVTDCKYSRDTVWSEYEDDYIPEDEAIYDEWFDDNIRVGDECTLVTAGGSHYTTCRGRIKNDADYVWSVHEGAFLMRNEAVEVGTTNKYDWYLEKDCQEDIYGEWHLLEECEWSDYHDGYVYRDDAVYCDYDDDWCCEDDAVLSEITGKYYLPGGSCEEDEENYRKTHACV